MDIQEAKRYLYQLCSEVHEAARLAERHSLKVPHIKLVRAATGLGLKDSKEIVERYWKSLYHEEMKQELLEMAERHGSSEMKNFVENNF